ncbi:MAG: general secretion pathway protein GspB [Thiobacillaceae bacterium]
MSYILDALRKSDQQRQRGLAPTLLTAQATVAAPEQSTFPYKSLLVAFLVGAGVVIGLLRPWQRDQPAPAAESVVAKPPLTDLHSAAPGPFSALSQGVGRPRTGPLLHESTSPAPPSATSALISPMKPRLIPAPPIETPTASSKPMTDVTGSAPTPTLRAPVGVAPTQGGPENQVLALSDLPPTIRQEIPDIVISFLAYSSNPKDRRIMINNAMMRQGDFLGPGIGLEQITPDGVIISYKGYRFRRELR